jgi:hypothetical protein
MITGWYLVEEISGVNDAYHRSGYVQKIRASETLQRWLDR